MQPSLPPEPTTRSRQPASPLPLEEHAASHSSSSSSSSRGPCLPGEGPISCISVASPVCCTGWLGVSSHHHPALGGVCGLEGDRNPYHAPCHADAITTALHTEAPCSQHSWKAGLGSGSPRRGEHCGQLAQKRRKQATCSLLMQKSGVLPKGTRSNRLSSSSSGDPSGRPCLTSWYAAGMHPTDALGEREGTQALQTAAMQPKRGKAGVWGSSTLSLGPHQRAWH